eukprot:9500338-Pyramimonas_sp.AAC.1
MRASSKSWGGVCTLAVTGTGGPVHGMHLSACKALSNLSKPHLRACRALSNLFWHVAHVSSGGSEASRRRWLPPQGCGAAGSAPQCAAKVVREALV